MATLRINGRNVQVGESIAAAAAIIERDYAGISRSITGKPKGLSWPMGFRVLDNVSAGYDIGSSWSGQERFIEVKATTVAGADLFLSANECEMLKTKGPHA